MSAVVEIFTDGACRGNPGPGGWAALLRYRNSSSAVSGAEPDTTNNRMELMAAIEGLERLTRPCQVVLSTDSEYLRRGITEWVPRWRQNGWRTSRKTAVKNRDLWQRLEAAAGRHRIDWRWVKGHSGHAENEAVDRLANEAIDDLERGPESAEKSVHGPMRRP